jgi:hypothetical protein
LRDHEHKRHGTVSLPAGIDPRPSEIARVTRGKLSTTRERLRRLGKRGVVEPASDGWRLAVANPTTPLSL